MKETSLVGLLVLFALCSLSADAQNYQLSRNVVIFGEANGVAVSLLQLLAEKRFNVAFVFNGLHHFDTETLIPKYASKVIQCSMVEAEYSQCSDLVAYASESNPLDVIIDLQSESAAEITSIYSLFEANRKPRIYTALSSHSVYLPCREASDVREYGEFHCPPIDDRLVPITADIHPVEYELGRRKLEIERELHSMFDKRGISYLALRIAPLFGARESLESIVSGENQGKKARLLTWILLSGISAQNNQTLRIPAAYRNYKWSVLYLGDLVKMAMAIDLLGNLPASQPFSRTYNLASARVTFKKFLTVLVGALGISEKLHLKFVEQNELAPGSENLFYPEFYPTTRMKPIETAYIQHELRFVPATLEFAMGETVAFYRNALVQFNPNAQPSHIDEPIRVAIDTLVNTGLISNEQINSFIDLLRNKAQGASSSIQSPESGSESGEKPHTEL